MHETLTRLTRHQFPVDCSHTRSLEVSGHMGNTGMGAWAIPLAGFWALAGADGTRVGRYK